MRALKLNKKMVKNCPKCNNKLKKGDLFCIKCGAKIKNAYKIRKLNIKKFFIFSGIFILALLVVLVIIANLTYKEEQQNNIKNTTCKNECEECNGCPHQCENNALSICKDSNIDGCKEKILIFNCSEVDIGQYRCAYDLDGYSCRDYSHSYSFYTLGWQDPIWRDNNLKSEKELYEGYTFYKREYSCKIIKLIDSLLVYYCERK